jgi:SET domain-containing protein
MMVVAHYIAQSEIDGFGVFAKEPIKSGELTWQYLAGFDFELAADDFPPQAREYVEHYGNMVRPGVYLLCGDNARFMNHSDKPNVSAGGEENHALRDIAAGEEITCDYSEFDIAFKGFSEMTARTHETPHRTPR